MDRHDLRRARAALPTLEPIWQSRRERLQAARNAVVSRLDQHTQERSDDTEIQPVYRDLVRIDRSLVFLDRALIHLDDIGHGTSHARDVPLNLDRFAAGPR